MAGVENAGMTILTTGPEKEEAKKGKQELAYLCGLYFHGTHASLASHVLCK
jgi:hypothetical protein